MTAMLYIQKAFRVSIRCSLGKTVQSDQTMYCISLNQDSNYLCNIFVSLTSQSFLFVHFIDIIILEGKKGTLTLEMFLNIWFQKMEPIKSQ